jgi:hypothetical protein
MRQSSVKLEKLQASFHWRGLPAILPSTFMATMALVSAPAGAPKAMLIFWPVDVPARGIAELCVGEGSGVRGYGLDIDTTSTGGARP